MAIPPENRKQIVDAYRAFYNRALKESDGTKDSADRLRAIGQRVLEELLSNALDRFELSSEERSAIRKEIEELIREEFVTALSDTPYGFDNEGFYKK